MTSPENEILELGKRVTALTDGWIREVKKRDEKIAELEEKLKALNVIAGLFVQLAERDTPVQRVSERKPECMNGHPLPGDWAFCHECKRLGDAERAAWGII